MNKGAEISACGKYRFTLTREWDPDAGKVVFIGLNPSTADASNDDPTIRRCIGFARAWGMGGLVMVNLFPFRATDPADMRAHTTPPDIMLHNVCLVEKQVKNASLAVAAWGSHGTHKRMGAAFTAWLFASGARLMCFGFTKNGQPRHPLYMKKDQNLEVYVPN